MSHAIKAELLELTRTARREMARHRVDCSEVEIAISHGVIHLYGRVRPVRGGEEEFDSAVAGLLKGLREKRGIRDVVVEWRR